jgi:hypothetical protein
MTCCSCSTRAASPSLATPIIAIADQTRTVSLMHDRAMAERLDYETEATVLVDVLRPALLNRTRLTDAELTVYWYPRERHRCVPIILETVANIGDDRSDCRTLETQRGHRITLGTGGHPKHTSMAQGNPTAMAPDPTPTPGSRRPVQSDTGTSWHKLAQAFPSFF